MLKLVLLTAFAATALVIPRKELLQRSGRDSIGQNRLYNNLFAFKRGQNRAPNEFEMIRSIAARFSTFDLTNEQRMMLQRFNTAPTVSHQQARRNSGPVIDLSKGWF